MKLLHTADWHLCDVLHKLDRTPHLRQQVQRVAALCEEHAVDVLVIAGDLFSDHSAVSVEKMTAELEFIHRTFAGFFQRGGTILAITGNHDKDTRIDFVRAGMNLAATTSGNTLAPGRMYLQNRPALVHLNGVQFALVPYPTYARYANPDDDFKSAEEVNRAIIGRVSEWVKELPARPDYDATKPGVLVTHLHVQGTEAHTLYKISEQDDVVFESGSIPAHWAYVALGHIHKPQCINNCEHIRYPGPLDRLSFSEIDDDRGVILVEIGPHGRVGSPVWLPLEPSTMYDLEVNDTAEIEANLAKYPQRETALVRMTIRETGAMSRAEFQKWAVKHFPRVLDFRWIKPEGEAGDSAENPKAKADYRETVRDYLRKELKDDKDLDDVLALAEQFLSEVAS